MFGRDDSGVKNKMQVDHINRDKSDCRRANLRICTSQQNSFNRMARRDSKTGIRGVTYDSKRDVYTAMIYCNGNAIPLGSFNDIDSAAKARSVAEKQYFGEYAPI